MLYLYYCQSYMYYVGSNNKMWYSMKSSAMENHDIDKLIYRVDKEVYCEMPHLYYTKMLRGASHHASSVPQW